MSILIKGMEMPEAGQTITIAVNWDGGLYARLEPVGDWCPLVEVPTPHGRLIDADDVNNHIVGFVDLSDCPTIIEAEGVE